MKRAKIHPRAKLVIMIAIGILVLPSLSAFILSNDYYAYGVSETWARTYGSPGSDALESVEQTSDGGYIVAGALGFDEFWVLKFDSLGNVQWQKTYGGGRANSIDQTSDGGYIAAGITDFPSDARVLKLDSDGNVEWEKKYENPDGGTAQSIQQTSDGGYIVGGGVSDSGSLDFWVFKLDSDGNVEWEKSYGGSGESRLQSVQQTSDGGYIAAGQTDAFGAGGRDLWFFKLDSDGNIEWEKTYGGTEHDNGYAVHQTFDGGYITVGEFDVLGTGNVFLLKLDADGNRDWEKTFVNAGFGGSVQQTSDGGYIVVGRGGEAFLVKTDPDGNIEWEKKYGVTAFNDEPHVRQTADGGYIVGAETQAGGSGDYDLRLFKVDSEGNIENCISDIVVQDSTSTIVDTTGMMHDTEANIEDTLAEVEEQESDVRNTSAIIASQCGPEAEVAYSLQLFENNNPTDGEVGPDHEIRAEAKSTDISVDRVTFRWINPMGDTVREENVALSSAANDVFAPDAPGDWIVEADFGNGQVITKTLSISFFVLPESPIGAVAMLTTSLAALGAFVYLRMHRKPLS